ncbi:MAG: hypothetical protein J6038_00615, partial [Bacilli bacterium]|nr:hypothetical protein [Bacilli bacterium]
TKKSPLITIRARPGTSIVGKLLDIGKLFDCNIDDLQIAMTETGQIEMTFLAVSNQGKLEVNELVAKLEAIEGVESVGVMNSHTA